MAAIRKLVREATDNGLMDEKLAGGILRVKSVKQRGRRLGNWLSPEDAQALLDAPDKNTLKGKRDRAMLAIMLGCGLRRSEVASIRWGQIQKRFGRWVLLDIEGKGGRVRSVAIPRWVKVALDDWRRAAKLKKDQVNLRAISKKGQGAHQGARVKVNLESPRIATLNECNARSLVKVNFGADASRRSC